ncbi:MAG: hypothetical protein PHF31_04665 [Methylobacter sp.]|nr:hypothetical protein [Methylobacter sp.]
MNGFLHRIAAQAMGSRDSSLHSVARLPYAISPSPVHNEEANGQVVTLGTKGNKRHPIVNNGAESDHVPSQNQLPDSNQAEIGAQALENEVIPTSSEVLIAQSATGITTKPDIEIVHPSSLKSRPRQAEKSVKKAAAGGSPVWDEVINTHTPLNYSATKSIANDGPYPTLTDSATPPPLLPLKNSAYPSALNSTAVAQRGEPRGSAWQSQVEETTEVHVSIGRIEITAVHEAPPPKRQAPATAKPMTLDEYLARRGREA